MGIVTSYLVNLIAKQVEGHRLVLWFDPEKHYEEVAAHLMLPDTTVLRYEGSFFSLRYLIEPFINELEPPRLIVYLPLNESETYHALAELEMLGGKVQPGHPSLSANTRLSLLARYALKPIMGEESANVLEKQVLAGKLTLVELDKLAETGEGITKGLASLIFSTGNAQEIALSFLNSEQYDTNIQEKGALAELEHLLHEAFEIEVQDGETPSSYRVRLARYLLATEFVAVLSGNLSPRLASVHVAQKAYSREACGQLVRMWRLRNDLVNRYVMHASRIEQELEIASIDFKPEQITNIETFLAIEKLHQAFLAIELQQKTTEELVDQAMAHQSCFWAEYLPEIQANWALIAVAGQVLLEANRIEQALRDPQLDAKTIFSAYAENDRPWCMLDTYHRHMERRYHEFSFSFTDSIEQLIIKARNRYMDVGATLAEQFLYRYQSGDFQIDGVPRQVHIYNKRVKPRLAEGKVAYVWVDALRYEMAHELVQSLSLDADPDIEPVLGTVPTITQIGMAALLPDAQGAKVVSAGEGKLALDIQGTIIKDRKDRINFLRAASGVKLFDARLDDLLPKPSKKIRDGIRDANLILITSQEIDMLGEENNIALARRTMDEVLRQLRQAFRILGQEKVKTIICTADHGYLFADELSSDMKIQPPGGYTADLHRRVWVGQGGEVGGAYLRTSLEKFGLNSDLDIAVPWNFAGFKVKGGADAYFHGGMSPQELILPLITLVPRKSSASGRSEITWTLYPGSQKITTRLFSVQIIGKATGLFELIAPKVRIEVRLGQTNIALPASASYGFEEATGDIQLKLSENEPQTIEPNKVTLLISETSPKATVSLHLLDSMSGIELARIDTITMSITL